MVLQYMSMQHKLFDKLVLVDLYC